MGCDPKYIRRVISGVISAPRIAASALLQPATSLEQQQDRLGICRGCKSLDTSQATDVSIGHCGACACARTSFSRLEKKAAIAYSSCPLKLWDVTTDLPDSRSDS